MSLSAVRFRFVLALSALCLTVSQAQAHFPWLAVDGDGRALVFFGESPDERNYHLPEALAEAKLFSRAGNGEPVEVATETLEADDFVGRRSNDPIAEDGVLELTAQYGIYHGMLLTYYAKEIPGTTVAAWEKAGPSKGLKLDVSPKASDEGLALVVTWEGQPLEGAGVALTDSAGDTQEAKTDAKGVATFKEPAAGPLSAITSYMKKCEKGEHEGKAYTSVGNYGTLNFNHKSATAGEKPAQNAASHTTSPHPNNTTCGVRHTSACAALRLKSVKNVCVVTHTTGSSIKPITVFSHVIGITNGAVGWYATFRLCNRTFRSRSGKRAFFFGAATFFDAPARRPPTAGSRSF